MPSEICLISRRICSLIACQKENSVGIVERLAMKELSKRSAQVNRVKSSVSQRGLYLFEGTCKKPQTAQYNLNGADGCH